MDQSSHPLLYGCEESRRFNRKMGNLRAIRERSRAKRWEERLSEDWRHGNSRWISRQDREESGKHENRKIGRWENHTGSYWRPAVNRRLRPLIIPLLFVALQACAPKSPAAPADSKPDLSGI